MRDFAFGIFPNFRAGGAVMGFRIHRIFVLIGIEGIGNFARQFFRHGIIAARIVGLDGRGANDHFRAESFEQIDFFARLLVSDGEDDFVAAHDGDQRKSHAGIAGSALDDRAAGLEHAAALGIVDHGDADAVFHRAARIQVIRLDVNLSGRIFGHAIQPDQRRIADSFEDVIAFHRRNPQFRGLQLSLESSPIAVKRQFPRRRDGFTSPRAREWCESSHGAG